MFFRSILAAAVALLSCNPVVAQTYSSCNPLYSRSPSPKSSATQTDKQSAGCPKDPALGTSINIDFTKGSVNSFTPSSDTVSYGSNGVSFTVSQSGDAPQLTSVFYIMFGKVEITMQAAPGAGIVSALVLQSDDLDEIDMEWLGADSTQVQTNYFGKGILTTYNRGEFNPTPNNQDGFVTYMIEWTSTQITWSVGGNIVRVLTPATADANQYPQTPMQVKLGAWSGGDPSNPSRHNRMGTRSNQLLRWALHNGCAIAGRHRLLYRNCLQIHRHLRLMGINRSNGGRSEWQLR